MRKEKQLYLFGLLLLRKLTLKQVLLLSFFCVFLLAAFIAIAFENRIAAQQAENIRELVSIGGIGTDDIADELRYGSNFAEFIKFIIGILAGWIIISYVAESFEALKRRLAKNGLRDDGYRSTESIGGEEKAILSLHKGFHEEIIACQAEISRYKTKIGEELESKSRLMVQNLRKANEDKEALKTQSIAILNILEDINASQEELKNANAILEKKQKELESLKSLSDELNGAEDVDSAIKIINEHLSKLIDFTTAVYVITNPSDDGSLAYYAYLKKPVDENYLVEAKQELKRYYCDTLKESISTVCKILDYINPRIYGEKLDNSTNLAMKSRMIVPLTIGDNIVGVIHLSSTSDVFEQKKEIDEHSSAMLATFSLSIARLQSLMVSQYSMTKSLVESLLDGVFMFNVDKKNVLMNPAAAKMTGLTFEGFSLEEMHRLFSEFDLEEKIDDAINSGSFFHLNKMKFIYYYYEIFISPVKDNGGKIVGCAVILRDITFLEEIDRMKTEFVSVASHQLRTPLTAIKLFTDMLLRGEVGELSKDQIEYLNHIFQSTDNMVALVYDLLNVTRIESGRLIVNPQLISVENLVSGTVAEIKPIAANKGIEFDFHAESVIPEVMIDQNLFRQVVHNLLTNAIRYSKPEGGKIQVKLGLRDDNFLIMVKDGGIGIPEPVQNRIFHKFFRADNAVKIETEGTGLGLYVSKMIIEASNGKLWFESEEGHGSTFYVSMPLAGMAEKKGDRGLVLS